MDRASFGKALRYSTVKSRKFWIKSSRGISASWGKGVAWGVWAAYSTLQMMPMYGPKVHILLAPYLLYLPFGEVIGETFVLFFR